MQQGRWVSYIFKYRNNARCENAGFIKVQRVASEYRVIPPKRNRMDRKTDTARIQVGMKMYKRQACRCLVYLMYRPDGAISPKVRFLEEMHFKPEERDTITKRFELDWDSPLGDGAPFDTYDGLFFVCDDGEVLAGMWDEYPFKPEEIKIDGINNAVGKENQNRKRQAGEDEPRVNKAVEENDQNNFILDANMKDISEPDIRQSESAENMPDISKNDRMQAGNAENHFMPGENMEGTSESDMTQAGSIENNRVPEENITNDSESDMMQVEAPADIAGTKEDGEEETLGSGDDRKNSHESNWEAQESKSCMDVCREMLDTFPRLPLFADSQFVECVKIVPHDIGRLAMSNWKLGINSFLSHGYYHYRYIMMGKVKFERRETYVIGVPGVYTNKEKYLANMFGFNIFVPAKRTKLMTGNFGYWISEILTE
ncbi:MAG: DUF6128 domain-containing protein [Clostridium sp.]|nr:DUF6128 domain-containing protein [Clostridium sp.]MCM1460771.1 DUF6128 domain-containing protein [Bacteroides sp.]